MCSTQLGTMHHSRATATIAVATAATAAAAISEQNFSQFETADVVFLLIVSWTSTYCCISTTLGGAGDE